MVIERAVVEWGILVVFVACMFAAAWWVGKVSSKGR